MASIIESAEFVEVLDLRGNTVGVGAGRRIASALVHHPELKVETLLLESSILEITKCHDRFSVIFTSIHDLLNSVLSLYDVFDSFF